MPDLHPPLSLYIHIPWCVRKCPYCDFNSHAAGEHIDETCYVDALLHDLDAELELAGARPLQSIFFGGGTPSLFSGTAIARILEAAADRLRFSDDIEITLEANPGTAEHADFGAYRSAGVNRLSLGIQSFDDTSLAALGRIHDSAQAQQAIKLAQAAGFDNINLDLMFGLPGQSLAAAEHDVRSACESGVQHISHYQLTLEPNTYFHRHPPTLPHNELIWDMQTRCHAILHEHGFTQYEVSAFAQPQRQSRHNLNYWQFGDYIGIGAGAHGKLSDIAGGTIRRRWKRRQPEDYLRHAATGALSGEEYIETNSLVFEYLLNALRLTRGAGFDTFEQNTGLSAGTLIDACRAVDPALLIMDEQGIRTSEKGFLFLNDVLQHFIE